MQSEMANRPPGCNVELRRMGGAVTVEIPPQGFRGLARALLIFAVVWNGFCLLMLVFMVGGILGMVQGEGNPWLGLLFMLPFLAVGTGILLGALHVARRRIVLVFSKESIVWTQTSVMGQKEKQWPRGDLKEIEIGASGIRVNNVPLMQLKLLWKSGRAIGLLTGRPDAELEWLRRSLLDQAELRHVELGDDAAGGTAKAERPANTRIELLRMGSMLTVRVPAMGFRGPAKFMLIFSLVWLAFCGIIFGVMLAVADKDFMLIFMAGFFCSVGVAMFVGGFVSARKRTAIVIAAGNATIRTEGIFGAKEKEFQNLRSAAMGDSTMKINDVPVPQLKLIFEGDQQHGLLTGLPADELEWLATEIRLTCS